jgi:gluconokinase
MIIILMGVTGVGKTTVGEALAAALKWKFADADEFHSPANIDKMHAGVPLNDADRVPWLQALHEAITNWIARTESVVLACSALKGSYRKRLMIGPEVKLVYLRAPFGAIVTRLATRHDHYMNPKLLESQFGTLEEPSGALTVEADQPVSEIVSTIRSALQV